MSAYIRETLFKGEYYVLVKKPEKPLAGLFGDMTEPFHWQVY